MSELIGLVQSCPDPSGAQAFRAMRATLSEVAGEPVGTTADSSMHWFADYRRLHHLAVPESGLQIYVAGAVFDGDAELDPAASAQLIARRYASAGISVGSELEGPFLAVIIDAANRRVLLVCDLLGTHTLYWYHRERFVFGSSLRAVTATLASGPQLDVLAAADYVHYGLLFGTKTLARDVSTVPAGSTVVYEWHRNTTRVVANRRPAALFEDQGLEQPTYLANVRTDFNAAVRRATGNRRAVGLSLSGGLDSRAILSALPPLDEPVRSYTVGVKLCADDVIASRLSKLAGTQHHFLEIGDQYLRDFLPNLDRMVALTDGMYLSHGLTEILALRAVEQSGIRTLLRGHCGELAKASLAWPFHTDPQVFSMRSVGEFAQHIFKRLNYVAGDVTPEALFHDDCRPIVSGAARRSLDETLVEAPALSPVDLCSYLYLTQHHRRFTIPSIELFRSRVDVRMPFADERFLRTLLGGRAEWRDRTDIHRFITSGNDRRLLNVRNSNTGAPGSAGPWLERLLDPVNSVLKRLNAPGYRHYHSFDAWMRTQLLMTVEEVLFDHATRTRGIYNMDTLRRLVDDTRTGAADRSYLLQVLLVLELWQRQVQQPRARDVA